MRLFKPTIFLLCASLLCIIICSGGAIVSTSLHAYATESVNSDAECPGDSDCDGLSDAREDANGNGQVDDGETDPRNPDTDADGLTDGEEVLHIGRVEEFLNEEEIKIRFPDRLDPLNPDSDGDCLPDGVELGISMEDMELLISKMPKRPSYVLSSKCDKILKDNNISKLENAIHEDEDAAGLYNMVALFDIDTESITDPSVDDTDNDGMLDGSEDKNFNGRRDKRDGEEDATEVSDGYELSWLETDPLKPDSDGDGIIDGDEGDRDGDGELGPDESDPIRSDTDGDGVSDGDEKRAGTRVNVCDTDGDGLSDGVEMGRIQPNDYNGCHGLQAAGSNFKKPTEMDPLNPDSDGDGLNDGVEDANGNGWLDPEESDPSIVDTDGDGLSDGVEALGDFDGDGIPDFDYRLITGDRGCSPPESISDIDCDGVPNARDDDSDNDGCSDKIEGGWLDANTNGIPDVYDFQTKVCPDEVDTGGGSFAPSESPDEDSAAGGPARLIFGANDGGACSLIHHKTGHHMTKLAGIVLIVIALIGISLRRSRSK